MNVTVIMPSLPARTEMREQALASILDQTYGEETGELIPTIVIMGYQPWDARNIAMEAAETEWIAFLDDDDWWGPDHLAVLMEAQAETGADLVWPKRTLYHNGLQAGAFPEGDEDFDETNNYVAISYVVRRSLALEVGGFPPRGDLPSDHAFLLRLRAGGARFHHVPRGTWTVRRHDGNIWSWGAGRGEAE